MYSCVVLCIPCVLSFLFLPTLVVHCARDLFMYIVYNYCQVALACGCVIMCVFLSLYIYSVVVFYPHDCSITIHAPCSHMKFSPI